MSKSSNASNGSRPKSSNGNGKKVAAAEPEAVSAVEAVQTPPQDSTPVKLKAKRQSMLVSPEDFIRIWQTSESLDDVRAAIVKSNGGIEPDSRTLCQRASLYRKKGVPLKKMSADRSIDWNGLKALATTFVK